MEKYRSLNSNYYHDAAGGLLIFDLTSAESYQHIDSIWHQDFVAHAPDDAFLFLVGNKADLKVQVSISEEEARLFANSKNMNYFQVSALTGEGIPELLNAILRMAPKHRGPSWDIDLTQAEPSSKCCSI
jgi:small GTP-binding protein